MIFSQRMIHVWSRRMCFVLGQVDCSINVCWCSQLIMPFKSSTFLLIFCLIVSHIIEIGSLLPLLTYFDIQSILFFISIAPLYIPYCCCLHDIFFQIFYFKPICIFEPKVCLPQRNNLKPGIVFSFRTGVQGN